MLKSINQTTHNQSSVVRKVDERIVPKDLLANPFLLDVIALDADKMFEFNLKALESLGYKDVKSYWHPQEGYIFARGTLPVCLCAHMDKVPYYSSIKKINKSYAVDKKGRVVDVILNSAQGIGGDDRCGVYAILSMLKLGHRPSVLFCMGEEIGCRGSNKFIQDYPEDFLSDINAFIQIDRRGNNDCVRYSDSNPDLTEAVCQFGFKHAWGSMTDISVLMPHFGISGVNLSSGYYHEHSGKTEYVSVKDVNRLLKRLDKILSSDIFTKRFKYKARSFEWSSYSSISKFAAKTDDKKEDKFDEKDLHQMSLFEDMPYIEDEYGMCEHCGKYVDTQDLVEIDSADYDLVCKDCAENVFKKQGYIECPSCGNLVKVDDDNKDPKQVHHFCGYCGCLLNDK